MGNMIRSMEKAGGGMGLNETNYTASTGLLSATSNNIDIHLEKNTEYGAILLLGASNYGKQGPDVMSRRMDKGETTGNGIQASTTGNKSGIYELGYTDMNINKYENELVAAASTTHTDIEIDSVLKFLATRYMDRYPNGNSRKNGDSLLAWHGSKLNSGLNSSSETDFIITRGNSEDGTGGAFSAVARKDSIYDIEGTMRPIIVCGEGF